MTGTTTQPEPQHPVQSRWVVYDSWEHEFSVYYDEQEAKKEYEGRIKQINDDVGNDEYDGDEEVYLCQVISKAEVVQVGIADDGDEGLYRLIAYDCISHTSAAGEAVLDELPHMSSTDLLLIAHDEWKRREERKHIHEETPWIHGWISGYLTSRKFVNERLAKLHQQQK